MCPLKRFVIYIHSDWLCFFFSIFPLVRKPSARISWLAITIRRFVNGRSRELCTKCDNCSIANAHNSTRTIHSAGHEEAISYLFSFCAFDLIENVAPGHINNDSRSDPLNRSRKTGAHKRRTAIDNGLPGRWLSTHAEESSINFSVRRLGVVVAIDQRSLRWPRRCRRHAIGASKAHKKKIFEHKYHRLDAFSSQSIP